MALRLCAQPAHRSQVWNALSDSPASCGPGLARDSLGRTRTTRPSATPYLSPNGSRREDGANEARCGGTFENDSSPRRCAREPLVPMHGFLGRLADVLARQLLTWLPRRVDRASRAWLVDLPRDGATQSAMLMAATCGVVLAAIMRESAGAPASFLSRHCFTALLIAGTISFAMADSLIRMRDRLLVADNVNHYAVLGSAMFAAILAGLIGRHGSRLSAKGPL